jgi:eukaryotic-like serine/threonine-protein kinase
VRYPSTHPKLILRCRNRGARKTRRLPACIQCKTELATGSRVCPECCTLQPLRMHRGPVGPGTTIDLGYGRIVIQARIGEGGMGVVWRGWLFFAPSHPRANEKPTPLALKLLRPQAGVREEVRTLFFNEADTLRRLSHPNIVRFFDFFEWGASLALAMEFVDGDTVADIISRHVERKKTAGRGSLPGMPFRRAWHYFQQLLGALAATHALSIVHQDVKPANILVRRDGFVKLTDFGIARFVRDSDPSLPSHGTAPGTGPYMSPEQVLSQPLDGRSDLYSAAIVFYEMLAGTPPFSPENKSEFLVRHEQVEVAPPHIRAFVPQAPPSLDALFARALAKEPSCRFSSAIEMGDAFRVALNLADTPVWRAQAEIAQNAPESKKGGNETAREHRLVTLRELVVRSYRTARLGE